MKPVTTTLIAGLLLIGVTTGGCKTAEVTNAPIATGTESSPSLDQIRGALTAGAKNRRWMVKDAGSGHLIATLTVRRHVAVVSIDYDRDSYSITYKDSEELRYSDGRIHRNYNRWIANLRQSINTQLANVR